LHPEAGKTDIPHFAAKRLRQTHEARSRGPAPRRPCRS
jgi:hypothetical protein